MKWYPLKNEMDRFQKKPISPRFVLKMAFFDHK
jgi:hypothetical protein